VCATPQPPKLLTVSDSRMSEKGPPPEIEVRPVGRMLVPYVTRQLAATGPDLPVHSVLVGPTAHPMLAQTVFRDVLERVGLGNRCSVTVSETPYREF